MTQEHPSPRGRTPWPEGDWFLDRGSPADLIAYERQEVLVRGRTAFQEYEIFTSSIFGKVLVLDDRVQSASRDEFIYHEALVQPVMTAHPDPRRVMIMGGGEGATLREVLRHQCVTDAVMVDIDAELVEVCKQWLPSFHQGAFDDPRTRLVVADARAWLAEQPDGAFDVIIVDLPEPLEAGPALKLFTREMYALIRRKLTPGGLMSVQSGSAGVAGQLMPDLYCTLRAVFPRVMPYVAFVSSFMDLYGFHVAGGEGFLWPGPEEVAARLEQRGVTGLQWFSPDYSVAVGRLPLYLARRLEEEGRLLTDEQPFGPRRPGERVFY
jgi:spermidine synthase